MNPVNMRLQSTGFHCYQIHGPSAIIRPLSLLKVIFTTRIIGCRGAGLSECDTPLMGGGDTSRVARNRPLITALLNAPRLLSPRRISGQPQRESSERGSDLGGTVAPRILGDSVDVYCL
ncbi:hypothetical protein E2C01_041578 [Portunus trituberculatus]|uniref:Uncharacterized protein n=1 Tax=Portunus trituberculatus TaxID=210409 RepID=A0A5B7FJM0_PORTR|nr:hypothetical protein [Portunus trituberculatus]